MSYIYGDYRSLAEAVGETERDNGLVFIPGEDYDPYDEEDRETVKLAMDLDLANRNRRLADENERLRALVNELQGYAD